MKTSTQRFENAGAVLIAVIIVIYTLQALYYSWAFTTDDAYISWHYADYLIKGQGFRWYAGNQVVEGYSNFLWVMLAALLIKLGLPLATSLKGFAILCLFTAFISLYCIARRFMSPLFAVLTLYLCTQYRGYTWWTVSGLETSCYLALVLLLTLYTLKAFGITERNEKKKSFQPRHWLITCLLLTLASLTRFEGPLWAIVLVGLISCLNYKQVFTQEQRNQVFFIFIMAFIVPYAGYFGWRLFYFGHIFPNSYQCKMANPHFHFYLIKDYLALAFPCVILSLPYLLHRFECKTIVLWLPSLLYGLLLWNADPIVAHHNRLFLAPFSLLSLMPVLGIHQFLGYFTRSQSIQALLSTVIVFLFSQYFIIKVDIPTTRLEVEHYQQRAAMRMQVASLLNQKVAAHARVLVADCGIIPFFSRPDIEFIDSECLNNPDMTSQSIQQSSIKYAYFLQTVVKPEWVIRNYYPKTDSEDELTLDMDKLGFFKQYDLIKTFYSEQLGWKNNKLIAIQPDHVYQIYQCKPAFCQRRLKPGFSEPSLPSPRGEKASPGGK